MSQYNESKELKDVKELKGSSLIELLNDSVLTQGVPELDNDKQSSSDSENLFDFQKRNSCK